MYLKKRPKSARQIGKTGQVTLEIALSLICVFLLLWGSVKVFVWVNGRLVLRQEDYESSADYGRIKAGSSSEEVPLQESVSPYPELDIFGK